MKYGRASLTCKWTVSPNSEWKNHEADQSRCVQYFDGIATFEEIVYRTGLPRRELDHLLELYKADVSDNAYKSRKQ